MNFRARCTAALLATTVIANPLFAGSEVSGTKAAVATPSPYTTQIGVNVLRNGGNAIDAAVAIAFALAVVEPQAGNIGGGGYLTYYDASTGAVWTLDFRELAPASSKADSYTDVKAVRGSALGAAIPGTVAGLDAMYRKFGSRPWQELLAPAIALANEGVRIDDDLAAKLAAARTERGIDQNASTAWVFYPGGKALTTADRLVQRDLAATLTRIGQAGPRDFYDGELAAKLVDATRSAGGAISVRDLREYTPIWRAPLRFRVGDNDIYAEGPPSGGGMELGIALNILAGFDLVGAGFQSPSALHLIAEAERRAAIDCAKYVGDPSSTRIPYRDLLSAERAAGWRKSIRADKVTPASTLADSGSPVALVEHGTQFVVADASGNVASITTTLGDSFGSGFVVPGLGFLLNDAMRDFTDASLNSVTNGIAPGKRPTDSMTSVFVVRGGHPTMAFGVSGDSAVNATALQLLLGTLLYGRPLSEVIAAPRYWQRNAPDQLEYERSGAPEATVNALNALGHAVFARDSLGRVNALALENGKITAIADPRGGGAAGAF